MENPLLKFFKQSSHYVFAHVIIMFSGFISLPILTRVFSKSEYGLFSLVGITFWLLLALSKAGVQESAVRFYGEFKDGKREGGLPEFFTTLLAGSFLFALITAFLVFILFRIILKDVLGTDFRDMIGLLIVLVISGSLFMRVMNFLRVEQKTKLLNLILVIHRYAGLALGLAFMFLIAKNLQAFFSGQILTEMIFVTILIFILIKHGKIDYKSFSIPFLKECLIFGLPLVGFEMANFLIKTTDRYLIQIFLGAEAVAVYSVGSNICHYFKDAIFSPVLHAVTPLYMELWNMKGELETRLFISKISSYLLLVTIPIIFGLIALGKQIVVILASEKYVEASYVIPFIIPGAVFWGFSPLYAAGLYIHKKTKKLTYILFVGVSVNVVLNIILIPIMNLAGAALSTLITYIVLMGLLMSVSVKYLKIRFDIYALLKSVFASAIMYFVLININYDSGILFLFIKFLIGLITYVSIILLIDKNVRQNVLNVLHRRFSHVSAM